MPMLLGFIFLKFGYQIALPVAEGGEMYYCRLLFQALASTATAFNPVTKPNALMRLALYIFRFSLRNFLSS